MDTVKTLEITKGVNLRILKADKFKTNSISLYLSFPMSRKTVTRGALIPKILKRGTEKYPSLSELSKRTQELYGASLGITNFKKGDLHIIRANIQYACDRFIGQEITADAVELLKEVVLCPKCTDGAFVEEWVCQEKVNQESLIKSLINDKKEYAQVRCNEIMFEGDPYGIFSQGYTEDLEKIDGRVLFDFYKELMDTASVDIFASGSFDEDKLTAVVKEAFGGLKARESGYGKTNLAEIEEGISVKRIEEPMPTAQSKLCMGFNMGVDPTSKEYYDAMVFGCIFGGSPFSKLFNNVREKLSLAYYVYSAIDRQKGCMKISAGIEAEMFDKAYGEIMLQLEKMQKGDFSDDEIVSAKKYIATGLSSTRDSLGATEQYYYTQLLLENDESISSLIENINRVDREGIIRAANTVQLDTVYFLKGVASDEV